MRQSNTTKGWTSTYFPSFLKGPKIVLQSKLISLPSILLNPTSSGNGSTFQQVTVGHVTARGVQAAVTYDNNSPSTIPQYLESPINNF